MGIFAVLRIQSTIFVYFCSLMEGKIKIHIEHPEAWELLVSIGGRQLNYILYAPSVAGSLIIGDVPLADNSLQALEDAVYNTPELLNEYKRVKVTVRSQHFVLFSDMVADDDCLSFLPRVYPEDDGDVAVCALPGHNTKIAWTMPSGMQAFLGRTFNYPAVCHHLAPMCAHFAELNAGAERSRMYVNMDDGSMDLAVYRDGALQSVNSFPLASHQDAVYYALNTWDSHHLDQMTDEIQVMGESEACAEIVPELREFVKHVMPAVYPAAAMRLGRNAMQAPLELILLALCE